MPNDKEKHSGHAQNGGSRILKNLSLLTLPWLALQLEILEIVKKGMVLKTDQEGAGGKQADKEDKNRLKDMDYILIKPIEHMVEREVHALMMILDRSQELRSRFGADLEKKLVHEFTNIIDKLAAGSVSFIEVQQIILKRIIEMLTKLKNEDKT